ncbi:MAG TPA: hypothetical protein VN956_00715 [Pyrinomonadaceae bacterium]|nr:hypothetical protein [Pyrinomonadaceae bacterium]
MNFPEATTFSGTHSRAVQISLFLSPLTDQHGAMDTHWQRVRQQGLHNLRLAEALLPSNK